VRQGHRLGGRRCAAEPEVASAGGGGAGWWRGVCVCCAHAGTAGSEGRYSMLTGLPSAQIQSTRQTSYCARVNACRRLSVRVNESSLYGFVPHAGGMPPLL
jgi:hypothetical protein